MKYKRIKKSCFPYLLILPTVLLIVLFLFIPITQVFKLEPSGLFYQQSYGNRNIYRYSKFSKASDKRSGFSKGVWSQPEMGCL